MAASAWRSSGGRTSGSPFLRTTAVAILLGINGTAGSKKGDIISAPVSGGSVTLGGGAGDDFIVLRDTGSWFDRTADNGAMATALNIDGDYSWGIIPGLTVGDDGVPRTSVLGQGGNATDWFAVVVAEGQNITLDIDAAGGRYGGAAWDAQLELVDANGNPITYSDDDGGASQGGLGSFSTLDPFISYTATAETAGTLYIHVGQYVRNQPPLQPIAAGNSYLLNVSVTDHANSGTFDDVTGTYTADGGDGDDAIFGGSTFNILLGGVGDDLLYGGDGGNSFQGGAGSDELTGGAGSDTFIFREGDGSDAVHGGDGVDTLDLSASSLGWTVDLGMGALQSAFGEVSAFDGIDAVIGSAADDVVVADPLAILSVDAGDGIDTLDLRPFSSPNATYEIDLAAGTTGFLEVIAHFENLISGDLDDHVTGTDAANVISTNSGDDQIKAGGGADTLSGGTGKNLIDGGGGVDTVSYADAAGPVVVDLSRTGYQLTNVSQDKLVQIENLIGGDSDDSLTGSRRANVLTGLDGADHLHGGGGADRFVFFAHGLADSGASPGTADLIDDFSHGQRDRIDLSGALTLDGAPLTFVSAHAFTGIDQVRYQKGGGETLIEVELDGDGLADMVIRLDGDIRLTKKDFILASAFGAPPAEDHAIVHPFAARHAAELMPHSPLEHLV